MRTKRYLLIGALLVMWLVTSACSCSGLLRGATRLGEEFISPTATPVRGPSAGEEVSTPLPTPTATSLSEKTAPPLFPEASDESFDIRLTEQKLNEYLADQALEQEGVVISDMAATIGEERISLTFRVAHEGSGIDGGVTVHGVPRVEDGQAYVEIQDFALDDSISGFKRIVANSLIEAALESYETDQGIPIPVTHLEFDEIQLMPGAIRVTGRTR
ncbi:MAG: hypothetical protein R6V13_04140 [Anaerolineae bacterium]